MAATRGPRWGIDVVWVLCWALVSSAWCVTAANQVGATFDEPGYLARGLEFWRTGSHGSQMKLGTMPLPMDLATLPIYLWEYANGIRIDAEGADLAWILPCARYVTLLFWWMILVYAFLAGRSIGGSWAGRIAVALIACEPCFLAHASLATSDIPVTACLLALVYHYSIGRDANWFWRVGVPAFWFGLAMLCKASALAFGPLCLFVVELERMIRLRLFANSDGTIRGRLAAIWGVWRPFRRELASIVAIGMVMIFLYCGSDWQTQRSFGIWARQLPEGSFASAMIWLAENLRIFPNAGDALVRQIGHNLRGHSVYILGHVDARSVWYYFPVALSMKLSATLLLIPLVIAVLRPRALLNWACLAAAGLLIYSLNCRVQIGIRFMLPLVALASVGLAAAIVMCWREHRQTLLRFGFAGGVSVGIAWSVLAATTVWPNALCYTNEFWGGTANGYRCLSDSNYDWGQGLNDLARWRREQNLDELDVWYFGTDTAINDPGFRSVPLHEPTIQTPEEGFRQVNGRYLAVSATLLNGAYGVNKNPTMPKKIQVRIAEYLRGLDPIDRTTTFLIFDLGELVAQNSPPDKSNLSRRDN